MAEAVQALYEGDIERAQQLLAPDDDLTVFEAAAVGRVARLQGLLEADPSSASGFSEDGFTALHLAVFAGQQDTARLLIDAGADVNVRATSTIARVPPLGTAAFVRSLALARLLFDAAADVNGQAAEGFTALHTAAHNGDLELARELLARGADPNHRTPTGKLPADLAATDELRALLAGRA